jgi:hypothetical protein
LRKSRFIKEYIDGDLDINKNQKKQSIYYLVKKLSTTRKFIWFIKTTYLFINTWKIKWTP